MERTRATRRGFLRALTAGAGGAAAAPLAERWLRVEQAFAAELRSLPVRVDPVTAAAALAPRYMLDPGVLYLNHASIGTIPRSVHDAHVAYLALCETNPWLYMWGGAWEEARAATRSSVARLLGAAPTDIALTHNTTEGFNTLARGLPLGPGDEVLFSSLNHAGASVCWEHVAAERGFTVRRFELPLEDLRGLTADDLVQLHVARIRDRTRVLVFPHVDNTVGVRHPLPELVAAARREGVEYIAVDGAQTVGMVDLDLPSTDVDFYAGSPHKWVQAPKGVGFLYVRRGLLDHLRPMWVTWGQERWAGTVRVLEDYGTRALPALLALGDAADLQLGLGAAAKEEVYRGLRLRLRDRVDASPRLTWRSPERWENGASLIAIGVTSAAGGGDADEIASTLFSEHGIVLRPFPGPGTLRVSPNLATAPEALDRFVDLLEGVVG